jgi:hypothetical protein
MDQDLCNLLFRIDLDHDPYESCHDSHRPRHDSFSARYGSRSGRYGSFSHWYGSFCDLNRSIFNPYGSIFDPIRSPTATCPPPSDPYGLIFASVSVFFGPIPIIFASIRILFWVVWTALQSISRGARSTGVAECPKFRSDLNFQSCFVRPEIPDIPSR